MNGNLPRLLLPLVLLFPIVAEGQLRRPGFVTIEREDRSKSRLAKEEGAIYLEGMFDGEVGIHVTQAAPLYANLNGDRWLGNLIPNQKAVLLAVHDRAYRVRAQAKQGQVSGWVSKSAVEGLPEDFEDTLGLIYERYLVISKLIEQRQVALGMTANEIIASIGPPDMRSSRIFDGGRTDVFEFISYQRVSQTVMTMDPFGHLVPVVQTVEVEAGRVVIEFENDVVTSISESDGLNFANSMPNVIVPPLVIFH